MSAHLDEAIHRLTRVARRTNRYLWTDAFAVCTLLGLRRTTGEARYEELALRLVERVHHVLGRHRSDDVRSGWISGLSEAEGEAHPTLGGLRIGKRLPERVETEPFDPELEWDRDGQYFHYLTKWMHALDQVARSTGRPSFELWARELAFTAHRAFTYGPREERRMRWKLSIDLTRPLVPSMGQHDPLDGYVTCRQIEATTRVLGGSSAEPSLGAATKDFAQMIDRELLVTADPLGLGGLLVDAHRLVQLGFADGELVESFLGAAVQGLRHYVMEPDLRSPADRRLAFRELGLTIGLAAVPLIRDDALRSGRELSLTARNSLDELDSYVPLRGEIESFWLSGEHRRAPTWHMNEDINDVMLATSLAPDGFLVLVEPERPSVRPAHRARSRAAAGSPKQ
jgi:hypothetical protein